MHIKENNFIQAYEKWERKQEKEPPRLPGLPNHSNKHLFFLNFAQVRTFLTKLQNGYSLLQADPDNLNN